MIYHIVFGLIAASVLIRPSECSMCDFWYECPGDQTCCANVFGMWKCCPIPSGICCEDKRKCCPQGTTCNHKAHTCEQSLGRRGFPFFPDAKLEFPANEMTDAVRVREGGPGVP